MYQQNYTTRNKRFSGRPFKRNFRHSHKWHNPRRSKLGSDLSLFIKKAQDNTVSESDTIHQSFSEFEINQTLKNNILNKGYQKPTPIQDTAIQPILQGKDLIGLASTGTGKTAAFLIPLIDKIYRKNYQKALIVTPTRELALQISEELKSLSLGLGIYCATIIGGASMHRQVSELRRHPNVVIGTPGRLKDLIQRRILTLNDYSIFVLDEVDLMVDIGFLADVKFFVSLLPKLRQSLFFSATISSKVREVLQLFVNNAVTVSVKKQPTAENVEQNIIKVNQREKKIEQLHDLLIQDDFEKVLIFGRTKHGVEKLHQELIFRGFKAAAIHGNKSQGQRQRVLESFKRGEVQVLLATDVASRGLDIENVSHVINYDLPQTYEDYIHRIGRTGRAGKTGTALTFVD